MSIKKKERPEKNSLVIQFWLRDEISRPAPGIHEVITRKKKKMRKRYQSDTNLNLYLKFCEEYGSIVGGTKFYQLKPFWVVPLKVTERDTTACKVHENFQFLFEKLRYHKVVLAPNARTFVKHAICNYNNKNCMCGECDKCKDFKIALNHDNVNTWYNAWITEKISRPGARGAIFTVKVTRKVKIECSLGELVNKFNNERRIFFTHVYRTHHQFQVLDEVRKDVRARKVSIIIDWSQNFEGKYFKEIHSTHFGASKTQISLHTGVFFYLDSSGETKMKSFCTVSDSLRHDACAVYAHLKPIINFIKQEVPDVNEISFQSDGPTTQYRNKTNFFLFNYHCKDWGLECASWHFSSPGHSKGFADSVGGSFKETLKREVCFGQDILCAQDITDIMEKKETKILVSKVDLEEIIDFDNLLPVDSLPSIPETMKVSQIVWTKSEENKLSSRYLLCNTCNLNQTCVHFDMPRSAVSYDNFQKQTSAIIDIGPLTDKIEFVNTCNSLQKSDFQIGNWVVVIFEGKWYPGVVRKLMKKNLLIHFTDRNARKFWWPLQVDEQKLFYSQILCIIEPLKEIRDYKGDSFLTMDDDQYDYVNCCAETVVIYVE